jgi:hypothetical protein
MKFHKPLIIAILFSFIILESNLVFAQFKNILKGIEKSIGSGSSLTENEIGIGLKEALAIGIQNAIGSVSNLDGYYKNPQIKIPLPSAIKKVEAVLRGVGYGSKLDAFELSMNRAAEKAAPEAKSIFGDAIKQMSISDSRKILEGRDNEATLYLKDKTFNRLSRIFKPIVHESMSLIGVTQQYQDLNTKIGSIPFTKPLSFDLDQYVTERALNGLFYMLAEEERKIREDPAARVNDLLKRVFGSQ